MGFYHKKRFVYENPRGVFYICWGYHFVLWSVQGKRQNNICIFVPNNTLLFFIVEGKRGLLSKTSQEGSCAFYFK